jgi:O-antigen ligase
VTANDITRERARSTGGAQPAERLRLWPPPQEGWLPILGVLLLYAGHLLYGALISDVSLLMGMAAAAMLGVILIHPRLREDLLRLKGLAAPAVLFLLTIAVGLWTLTPWIPGGAHPVWAYVGVRPGASTIDRSATLIEILKLLGLACVFLVGAATGARDARARYAIRLTLAVGVVFGLWAFIGSATDPIYRPQGHRLEGHFHNPNTAGTFFAVLLMLAISELTRQLRLEGRRRSLADSLPYAAPVLLFAACLLVTASRGAMMAFLGGVVILIVFRLATGGLKLSRAVIGLLAGALLLIGAVAVAGETLIDRLFQSHEAAIVRTAIWQAHWQAFLDSPLFGYGLGTAETVNKTLISVSNYPILWNIKAILNLYLQWLEEAGIVGTVPMFLSVALLIFTSVRNGLGRSRMTGVMASLLAVDAIFLIHGATDFGLEVYSIAALWSWLLGLQFSLAQGSSRR